MIGVPSLSRGAEIKNLRFYCIVIKARLLKQRYYNF
jgi:hypothetical protein